jgi:hypothetical protein
MAGPGRATEKARSTIELDTQGRILASDAARAELADRAGSFALLPSSGDLIVLARAKANGGPAASPRCVFAGDLSVFPIADFLAFIHTTRVTGTLTVVAGGIERAIVFQHGEVRAASSQARAEQIGEVALRSRLVTREQLDAMIPDADGMRFGGAMVSAGILSADDLSTCFHEQVTNVFHELLLAREGVFTLDDRAGPDVASPLSIETQSLLFNGIRRIDELSLFTSRIPGTHAIVCRREPNGSVHLEPLEEQLLQLVDGRRRVLDVAQAACLSELDAMKILFRLSELGYVDASTEAAPSAASPALSAATDLVRTANGVLRAITGTAALSGAQEGLAEATRTFLADPESRFEPLFRGVELRDDGALDEATLLGNLSLLRDSGLRASTAEPARLLRDGLREALFFQLFHLSERLPADEDERLAADVRQRLAVAGGLR